MASAADDIIDAALKLPEAERLLIVARLLDTLPEEAPGLSDEDPGFLEELDRRTGDNSPTVPLSQLWSQD